ncbi:two-component system, NarL family, sensor histidine kinase DegS [Acetitomaculum ruminis DSM 5522]|uniref:histidine kinase n=1 Tax=Acetitomaculum ruminis DSM 5522 TaxID=1120918 RepID=A0A1I0ZCS4_9FIRM|nr:histidine kinase [Acetitomaculum ruminis]SFB23589.1 two-component system, NarL family, sensor histidine kinase DegS [Acetitomaculum ruminis DSM 5522]
MEKIQFLEKEKVSVHNEIDALKKELETNEIEIEKLTMILEEESKKTSTADVFYPKKSTFGTKNIKIKNLNSNITNLKDRNRSLSSKIEEISIKEKDIEYILSHIKDLIKGNEEKFVSIEPISIVNNENTLFPEENHGNNLKVLEELEKERQRIARDLHDTSIQNLTSFVHKIEYISKLVDKDLVKSKLELKILENNLRSTIDDMRNIVYNLHPMALDDLTLNDYISNELTKLENLNHVNIKFESFGEAKKLKSIVTITIVRIIQEACNNAIKHCKFNLINVTLTYNKNNIVITINNDGKGFDVDKALNNGKRTFGLSMMQERVNLLSGNISIKSDLKKGTKIKIKIPIGEQEEKI